MEKRFSASKGQSVWLITGLIVIIYCIVTFLKFKPLLFNEYTMELKWIDIIMLLLFIILIGGTWLYSTLSYSLTADSLNINRPVGKKKIPLTDIKSARTVSKEEMGTMLRKFGNGGLFGFFGKFWSSNFGNLTYHATRRNKLVLIETKAGKKYVVTPDEDADFVQALNSRISS